MKKWILIVFLVGLLTPTKALAWGEKGHELVAEIAFKHLDRKTRKLVMKYLDGMSIEKAATWMDDIKKDKAYDNLKPLHYVNFDKGTSVKDTCCDNIIYTLTKTINDLKHYKDFSKEEVKTKLCFLFHLIGDLHQPLHVGYGSDKGGNSVQVHFKNKGTNLHGLYDYGIIEYKELTLRQCLRSNTFTEKDTQGSVLDWAKESRSYLDGIYATNGQDISDSYVDTHFIIIKNQLNKAGIRLASILKASFGS